jgi:3',5'-cyclic-AMP phosphodiesterase
VQISEIRGYSSPIHSAMQRREFLKNAALSALLLPSGALLNPQPADFLQKPRLRLAVASDGHFGQADTDYVAYFQRLVEEVSKQHQIKPIDACVINGDIIHDDKRFLPQAKAALGPLPIPYYVTQGNHDQCTPAEWQAVWGQTVNQVVELKKSVLLLGTTSNEKGEYLEPDVDWFFQQLEKYRSRPNVFIFVHITPVKWTKYGVDGKAFQELLAKYPNVRGVFNGHDHDQDGIKMQGRVPYLFDAHFGGSWGTSYRGFRMVELRKDGSILTYLMDPAEKLNEETLPAN